ncbi:MAG: uncharacterized protein KVP18_002832 [Porospora cf. gigantea A]|uniref:uncharacterized protein n=1 Tax=Porospora cf. gigantea A TaxID=2853593 RepID=UPI003559C046|nr:MAG: hypothetical protein KVP18_002832 [Porospora cf. gigantea A]
MGNIGTDNSVLLGTAELVNYVVFCVCAFLTGAVFPTVGPKLLMCLAGAAFATGVTLVYFSKVAGWMRVVGAVAQGGGAGMVWTCQTALINSYASALERIVYLRDFWFVFTTSGVMCGIVIMVVPRDVEVSHLTFCLLLGVMLVSACLSACLISDPNAVMRTDGSPVLFLKSASLKSDFSLLISAAGDSVMIKMMPLILTSAWSDTYEFRRLIPSLLDREAQGLTIAFYSVAQMIGVQLLVVVVGTRRLEAHRRDKAAFLLHCILCVIAFGSTLLLQYLFTCGVGWEKGDGHCSPARGSAGTNICPPGYKWVSGCNLGSGDLEYLSILTTVVLMGMQNAVQHCWGLWVLSMHADGSVATNVRYAAYFRSIEGAGAGISWALDRTALSSGAQLVICTVLVGLGTASSCVAADRLSEKSHEQPSQVNAKSVRFQTGHKRAYGPLSEENDNDSLDSAWPNSTDNLLRS